MKSKTKLSTKEKRKAALEESSKTIFKKLSKLPLDTIVLDTEIIGVFAQLCELGRPLSVICDYLGIPQALVAKWKNDALLYERGGLKTHAIYNEFLKETRRGASAYLMTVQDKQGNYPAGEWQKFAWVLERRDPKNWNRQGGDDSVQGGVEDNGKFL